MIDWDDLQVFLAVARAGSLSGGAKILGVNHSTVFRRIGGFEDKLGVRLFDRARDGYSLTLAGSDLLQTAAKVEMEIDAADRRVTGRDLRLSGPLNVTTTESLMINLLGAPIAAFRNAYPGIDLTILVDTQFFNLSKRQADVAIRPTTNPPEILVGRRLCDLGFAVYGGPGLIESRGRIGDLSDYPWVMPDDALGHLSSSRWLAKELPNASVVLRSNNLSALMTAAVSGMGLALLPCFMGDTHPALIRVHDPIAAAGSALWLLTHEDLRKTQRVRAFMDFMADTLIAERDLLEGRRAGSQLPDKRA